MRRSGALAALLLVPAFGACAPDRAETPCPATGNTPVVRADTAGQAGRTIDPGPPRDSAMLVAPPCPDTIG
jgi:hypothetical protein